MSVSAIFNNTWYLTTLHGTQNVVHAQIEMRVFRVEDVTAFSRALENWQLLNALELRLNLT